MAGDNASMRVKRFYKKTERKLEFNGKEPVGFDKIKVECFNCHRRGHFTKDCRTTRNPRNKGRDARNAWYRGRDNGKRHAREEDEKALSYQLVEKATDCALMAFTSNPLSSSSSKSELDEALREKEDLKAKLEKFDTSSKNLTKLLNSQISAKVKTDLGYDSQFNKKEVLDVKEEEVTVTVFDNRSSDEENSLANDRFKKGKGYHAVPLPLTGNYMPPKLNLSFATLDDSIYKFKISKIVTSLTKDVKDAFETSTTFVEKPKDVRTSAPLIQDWDTDSDNDSVFRPKHIPANIDFIKAGESVKPIKSVKRVKPVKPVKTAEQTEEFKNFSSSPTVGKVDQFGTMFKKINHQNKFAPTVVFTRFGRIPVSAAKLRAATSTSSAKPIITAGPKQSVDISKSISTFHKSHSPIRRSFYNATTHLRSNLNERVNTAGSKAVSAVKENRVTVVNALVGSSTTSFKYKGIVDSGCSRHMTGNKSYLADYQEINDGGFVAFGLSK
nr:hypothetical protein [Tanacetum cinerariifolium]